MGAAAVTGTLTVRGVARRVELAARHTESAAGAFTVRATTRVDRTEFGVTGARGKAGRHLEIVLEAVCVRA